MTPSNNRNYENMEIIKIGAKTYMKEPFGPGAFKLVEELDPAGQMIDVMQTTLMRKQEGKRFYF